MKRWRRSGPPMCAFALVTGCPRSGTTAMLNWLGRQPGVTIHEESRILHAAVAFLREVERFSSLSSRRARLKELLAALVATSAIDGASAGTRLVVEKEPLEPIAVPDANYAGWLATVRSLIPPLRILFMIRDPLEVVSSMLARTWGHSLTQGPIVSLGIDACIDTWLANARLAIELHNDPQVLVLNHAHLVARPDETSRQVEAFLSLGSVSIFTPSPTRPSVLAPGQAQAVGAATAREWRRLRELP
ncbi:MAG: sulfotransferase [Gemmatimonadota bacterium]